MIQGLIGDPSFWRWGFTFSYMLPVVVRTGQWCWDRVIIVDIAITGRLLLLSAPVVVLPTVLPRMKNQKGSERVLTT